MMNALKLRAESYNEWAVTVSDALEAKMSKKRSACQEGPESARGLVAEPCRVAQPRRSCRLCRRLTQQEPGRFKPRDGETPRIPEGPDGGQCTMVLHAGHMAESRVTFTSLSQKQKCFTFYTEP